MNELADRMQRLTDEKYDWLDKRREENPSFNFETETMVWYTKKIAELELKLESLKLL